MMSRPATKNKSPKAPASEPAKLYRFDARLNEAQKVLIQRAADIEGRSMTDFVLHSAEIAAEKTIQNRVMLVLSVKETETFVNVILSPREPGAVLRKAVLHYKKHIGVK